MEGHIVGKRENGGYQLPQSFQYLFFLTAVGGWNYVVKGCLSALAKHIAVDEKEPKNFR